MQQQVKDYLLEPLTIGAVGGIASRVIFGNRNFVTAGGTRINLALMLAGGITVGKIVDNLISQEVFPHIVRDGLRPLNAPLSEALSIGTILAVDSGINYMANSGGSVPMLQLLGTAVTAEVVGQYAFEKWIGPLMDTFLA